MTVRELVEMLTGCEPTAEAVVVYEQDNPLREGNEIADVIEITECKKEKTTVAITNR